MTIGISTSMRSNRLQLILDAIDIASDEYNGAHLLIYSGVRPATEEAIDEYENDLLVDFILPWPCGTITGGVLSFSTVEDATSVAYGIAVWARITDADDTFVMDLSVTSTSGSGDVKIDSTEIFESTLISCTVATITEGNV